MASSSAMNTSIDSTSSLLTDGKPVCSVYESHSLISGLPLQIECIAGYDDYILLGSKEGHLLIYKIIFKSQGRTSPEIEMVSSNKNFSLAIGSGGSRKPVTQLEAIPEHKILIVMTSEGVSIHDMAMHNCKCISIVERTKGAACFALNIQRQTSLTGDPSITVRMCVVVGKTLQLYYWKNRSFFPLRDDLAVPDTPKAISWCKETILLGFKNEYCYLDLLSGKQQDVCLKSKQGDPIISVISADEYAVVSEKQCFIFQTSRSDVPNKNRPLDPEKESKKKNVVLSWSECPVALIHDEPYFIGILPGKGIEVRTIKPKLKIDSFPIHQVKLACRTKSGHVLIASLNSIWCLKSTPVIAQMDLFVRQHHFELALGLSNIWDEVPSEKAKKINQIKNLYAFHLFCQKKFKQAMGIFMQLGTDASHVIGLFPGLLPSEFRHQIEYPGVVPELRGADFESGMSSLIVFLTNSRTVLLGNSNQTITEAASIVEGGHTIKSKRQLLQIIDTTLLKCYLQTNESLVASLLRLKDNYCHIEETERALIKDKKINELIILYQTKGNHRKALETLQKQNNTERLVDYLQNLGREEMDLILEFSKPILQSDLKQGLRIFTEDIQEVELLSRPRVYDFLLKNCPDVIIPYLEHVIFVWEDKNSIFHNALINQYREEYQNSNSEDVKQKLLKFLKESAHYTPEFVLVQFPFESMFEERALILEKLGRHDQAISIYVNVLKDVQRAMDYCSRVYDKSDVEKKEVFTVLMKELLTGPTSGGLPGMTLQTEPHVPDIKNVMKLLKEYAPYLDPLNVLSCLPDNVEARDVKKFLKTSVQNHLSDKRKILIQKGLINAEFLRATKAKIWAESNRFYVVDSTTCIVCNKRLASQNAFLRSPDESIVHYYCQPQALDGIERDRDGP